MPINRTGQSIIEYAVIVMLVILAIVIGGPFLRNSVQGFLRNQGSILRDSELENLRQDKKHIPTHGVNAIPKFECACTPPEKESLANWERAECGSGPCEFSQRLYTRRCSPEGCDIDSRCVTDSDCCSKINNLDCGPHIDNSSEYATCNKRKELSEHFNKAIYKGTCINTGNQSNPQHPKNKQTIDTLECAIGEQRVSILCGNPEKGIVEHFACAPDNRCLPACSDYQENSTPCTSDSWNNRSNMWQETAYRTQGGFPAGTDKPFRPINRFSRTPETNLTYPYTTGSDKAGYKAWQLPFAYIPNKESCESERFCQNYCNTGYLPAPDGRSCKPANCQNKNDSEFIYEHVGIHEALVYKSVPQDYPNTFEITVRADNLNYGVACFDNGGTMLARSGTIEFYKCSESDSISVGGQKYCYQDTYVADLGEDIEQKEATCPSANYIVLRVLHGGDKAMHDKNKTKQLMGYEVKYIQCSPQ